MPVIVIFGVPGSGKTTHAAKIVYKNLKKGIPTYSNVIIKGSLLIDASKIGTFSIENGDLIIDEASIEFNNRNYKSLPKKTIEWFKLYRHYGIRNIYIYSQSYEDMDITLRRLSDVMYLQKRTLIPGIFVSKEIRKVIGIDKDTHQIQDQYSFKPFSFMFTFGRRYWKLFDSWSAPKLPDDNLKITGYEEIEPNEKNLKWLFKKMKRRK